MTDTVTEHMCRTLGGKTEVINYPAGQRTPHRETWSLSVHVCREVGRVGYVRAHMRALHVWTPTK